MLIFASLISPSKIICLRSNIKHLTQCFITRWNTLKFVKNTLLRNVFSTLFSLFHLVMKERISCLIYNASVNCSCAQPPICPPCQSGSGVVSLRLKIRQRIPFVFLGVKLPCFFNFPICQARHEKIVIFIGCNFESRGSQVGLHKRNQRYCVSKEGKSELTAFLIYSQKARMSRIYYLRSRSSLGCFAAKKECSAG